MGESQSIMKAMNTARSDRQILIYFLVPRLCLGTQCTRGSASPARMQLVGGACGAVRSQAEPGNEKLRRQEALGARSSDIIGANGLGHRTMRLHAWKNASKDFLEELI